MPGGRIQPGGGIAVDDLPRAAGTYILVMRARQAAAVQIGRLGLLHLQPGWYLYTGSAFGPGGLRGRLGHHLAHAAHPRWHVDYLRVVCELAEIWYSTDAQRLEHVWGQNLCAQAGFSPPLARFGASDCACPAHLVYCAEEASLLRLADQLPGFGGQLD